MAPRQPFQADTYRGQRFDRHRRVVQPAERIAPFAAMQSSRGESAAPEQAVEVRERAPADQCERTGGSGAQSFQELQELWIDGHGLRMLGQLE